MSEPLCPIECIKTGCEKDFLEKHDGFIITIVGSVGAVIGVFLTYFLKSRCKNIKTPCASCDRDVVDLDKDSVEIVTNNNNNE